MVGMVYYVCLGPLVNRTAPYAQQAAVGRPLTPPTWVIPCMCSPDILHDDADSNFLPVRPRSPSKAYTSSISLMLTWTAFSTCLIVGVSLWR